MASTTTTTVAVASSLPFMRRRSSAAPAPIAVSVSPTVATTHDMNALTAFFLPEATTATLALTETVGADMTESLLSFDVDDERLEEEEYLKHDLPESILPMSPEPSPRNRSASALSTAAIESVGAALTSWFSYEDFEGDADAVTDEDVDESDEDFLRDDYMQRRVEPTPEVMPTCEKLSLIAEEDFAQTVASVQQPWAAKAFAWPWLRTN